MSEAVSALGGARFQGIADIAELGLQGMITLRGDLGSAKVHSAVKSITGLPVPAINRVQLADSYGVCWMSPDELLLLVPYTEVANQLDALTSQLSGEHALAVDVSDARAVFSVSGPYARDVLAKLAPVDLAAERFTSGMIRRTRIAQVPAAFWLSDEDSFQIVCFRSVAQYMFDLLSVAAQDGSEIHMDW